MTQLWRCRSSSLHSDILTVSPDSTLDARRNIAGEFVGKRTKDEMKAGLPRSPERDRQISHETVELDLALIDQDCY